MPSALRLPPLYEGGKEEDLREGVTQDPLFADAAAKPVDHAVDEGMEHILQGNARKHMDYPSFLQACITQRYPRSSIQRSLPLTHTDKQEIDHLSPCLVDSGLHDTGRAYLLS